MDSNLEPIVACLWQVVRYVWIALISIGVAGCSISTPWGDFVVASPVDVKVSTAKSAP